MRGMMMLASMVACGALLAAPGCMDEAPPASSGPSSEESPLRAASATSLADVDRRRCGGIQGLQCRRGEVCINEPGTCDVSDNLGYCQKRPEICPRYWQPVCGCDGVTYGNVCEATAAGASIDHRGECVVEQACADNGDCGRSRYCEKDACGDERGTCELRPLACPQIYRPVCGCDGRTYGNACEAASFGANVAHEGECRDLGCETNADCASRTFYCAKKEGCDGKGECTARPLNCPEIYRPVCGCDGNTYDNACFAASSMTNVAYQGTCEPTACEHTAQCPDPENQFCNKRQCGGVGLCADRPDACPDVWDPVCACNGQTYGNACEANAAGQVVRFEGTCFCGGIAGFQCDDGEFCDPDPGQCDVSDVAGMCVEQTQGCPRVWDPVCGCDGRTYGNDCERIAAGAAKDYDGECRKKCCDPREEPGTNGNPYCFEGASCCDDGEWACNGPGGRPTCGASLSSDALSASGLGEVCEDRCEPVLCELYCENGFANGPDGCPICQCRPSFEAAE